ncbi:mannose-1-phosphate guanylyltransferase [Clostridium acetobutylicum]|uniref:mannose-1-phosphate guanylyltransferase n=1 Tax=Clostridium acetobutylicum (strain ATCC 824 / DSM 792 / JCM 1419 / IAM 19013 / LMG 5710 / NBRC 13948 / NRRL B-527 / VKM B-1787 / 2291 / W) TaxID=272562 RepID=Q97EY7_CLOAB|nr:MULTISPECIES: mannose-1-phosphate guanylyltransferase [Clostridium]AAK80910.1 Mannose-1-phosphate guanylyltransferase [Clostridium acetobutylicum ATCC 824]ADZ22012.1 Mannose-1-phosphate guanylyltransferase [Clostridium acetobutylicum EA 2018]AEI32627.1 mannose-1-phosphate guanylyltransferase [Clostridium acetobutylicum DSM 1731]AWV78678.1 mannose-1-phosphate guanylyltransferase [Clostridium acetobutylicum]KHD37271.1 mannose-1-phosphate guanylyltransferase [Clostridium acetobutylicum]
MLYALVLAGGKGTRLYPLSRKESPKQFLKFIHNKSFLRNTVDRIKTLVDKENIYIVTNERYINKIQEELPEINRSNIFTEPENKETATCIGLSAVKLLKKDSDATMIVLPSDHYIENEKEFIDTLRQGVEVVERKRCLVTMGITPTRPETGYGYIQMGDKVINYESIYKVERFLEKPNIEVAKDLLSKGNYLWNSGMFVWRADTYLREMNKYLPKMYKAMMEIYENVGTKTEEETINEKYKIIDGISVDFGIMQKTRKAYVVKANFEWDDLGNFSSLARFLKSYEGGNTISDNVFLEDTENCSIFGSENLIICFGVKDLIVVDAGNVVLIMDKNRDQELKHLVEELKNKKEIEDYL